MPAISTAHPTFGSANEELNLGMDDHKKERSLALQPPAVLSNRFFIVATGGQVRIAFGEVGPEGPIYKLATVVSRANAQELANLLNTLLKGQENPQSEAGVGGASYH
ncbi:hypothetical protein [Tabrizicola sp.]|uniref:hypothetical protein n=1 Tax=Tabrizicola sp. TaxID=2005166 RepID=UPI002736E956|nr:hypothetical protein [Tabrizicola sp.]MDP3196663.1 hypothetical protein [Tabrizicola sp.]